MIEYTAAHTVQHLEGILRLQQVNLPVNISATEAREQGFLTLVHDLSTLAAMNEDYGHSIALADGEVVGYALMMQTKFDSHVPALKGLMNMLENQQWNGKPLQAYNYFIMGQVCVAKDYRGQGVFAGLYEHQKQHCQHDFDLIITDIAARNTRSCRAHAKVGFVEMARFIDTDEQEWVIVGMECKA